MSKYRDKIISSEINKLSSFELMAYTLHTYGNYIVGIKDADILIKQLNKNAGISCHKVFYPHHFDFDKDTYCLVVDKINKKKYNLFIDKINKTIDKKSLKKKGAKRK